MRHTTAVLQERWNAHENLLTNKYGPPPVCNFKHLRLQSNLSLAGLALQTGLSKNAIVRAEQGTYANPLPRLSEYYQRRFNISELEITLGYEDFQAAQRQRHYHYFGDTLIYSELDQVHPFRQLRLSKHSLAHPDVLLPVGPDAVSRALCIPVDTLRFWEKKFKSQKSVPKLVVNVLNQIGYDRSTIANFCKAYEYWRTQHTGLKLMDKYEHETVI